MSAGESDGQLRRKRKTEDREAMQVRKTRAIGVDGEQRATAPAVATIRCPIQGIARQNQPSNRIGSVSVSNSGTSETRASETMQVCETRAVGVDPEQRASARTTTIRCRPIKSLAR